jgi:hypothetical protein
MSMSDKVIAGTVVGLGMTALGLVGLAPLGIIAAIAAAPSFMQAIREGRLERTTERHDYTDDRIDSNHQNERRSPLGPSRRNEAYFRRHGRN